MSGWLVLLLVLVVATVAGLVYRARSGRLRDTPVVVPDEGEDSSAAHPHPTAGAGNVTTGSDPRSAGYLRSDDLLRSIGGDPASSVTLLQFSSEFCQPCRATRVILSDVAASVSGVQHLELDVAEHLDLVRHYDIRRTPTVFVLDSSGAVRKRASGQPHKADVLAAVGSLIGTNPPHSGGS